MRKKNNLINNTIPSREKLVLYRVSDDTLSFHGYRYSFSDLLIFDMQFSWRLLEHFILYPNNLEEYTMKRLFNEDG